ncbi:MAG: class I SAM-dependent methyltransferase [Acidobacteria bacterium]|nr:class I SAM-dependent methyltransferase [Acidobacteriota bacterium]
MKEFESRLGRKGRVLDLGCGLGEFMWAARESGWQVSGIDPSKEFVQEANRRFDLEAKVSTLEEAAFPDEHFDAVIMSGIIEHLYDPYSTLVEVNRIIRPGGWLFLDAPNENGLYMRMGNLYMRLLGKRHVVVLAPTFPPYHVQGFNTQSIRRALTRAGFTVASLEIAGGVCEQVGPSNIRKKAEYGAGKMINGIGRLIGMGSYMAVWSKKGPSTAERPD